MTLFVREDVHVTSNVELRNYVLPALFGVTQSNVELRNYIQLFGMTQSNVDLRNITSDCYLNIVVSLDCY